MRVLRATMLAAVCAATTTGATSASLRDVERSDTVTVVAVTPPETPELAPQVADDETVPDNTVLAIVTADTAVAETTVPALTTGVTEPTATTAPTDTTEAPATTRPTETSEAPTTGDTSVEVIAGVGDASAAGYADQ